MKNLLEIILITYNRAPNLQRTLQALFAPQSPVKDIPITVLDNHSTDTTPSLLQQFSKIHPNLRVISHPKNIGSNANIVRAFEMATASYVWVLCDDDDLHWESWTEVTQAMQEGTDAIVVNTEYTSSKNLNKGQLYRLVTFLPSAIYKTSLLDDTVLFNMYNNVPTWFPHLAVMAKILNSQGKIYVTTSPLVTAGKDENNGTIKLAQQETLSNKTLPVINQLLEGVGTRPTHQFIELGYLQVCDLLTDPAIRKQAVESCITGTSFPHSLRKIIRNNWKYHNGYLGQLIPSFCALSTRQKLTGFFIFALQLLEVPKYKISYRKHCKTLAAYKKHFQTDDTH